MRFDEKSFCLLHVEDQDVFVRLFDVMFIKDAVSAESLVTHNMRGDR